MTGYTITRNGKAVFTGDYKQQKRFFFRLYFYLLVAKKWFDGKRVLDFIRSTYTLTDNFFGTAEAIYC